MNKANFLSFISIFKERKSDSQIDSLAKLNLCVVSYLLHLIKAVALGDAPFSFPGTTILGDLLLNKRHLQPMSFFSTYFPNFFAFFPFSFIWYDWSNGQTPRPLTLSWSVYIIEKTMSLCDRDKKRNAFPTCCGCVPQQQYRHTYIYIHMYSYYSLIWIKFFHL